ncbi:NAD(P)H-dependent flavin oxidoreductase [Notoacmeibacter ruber]|uniref:Propionate 3-nitronate monooxygenase n=1 Tax=Notoacmeibacter ruber TaxID=2670375 RepID=A0A3L7JD37_9HYPH|nr:nitronate monooxygenase [Notoacmeibacter ruber]RLQ88390.1 nitronate monooxygenase [Notoacmeibacter ruber]
MTSSAFSEWFNADYPIIQAPMAGVTTPKLAAAVCEAGAIGALGLGAMNADTARKHVEELHSMTAKPFILNVFCHADKASDDETERNWITTLSNEFERFGKKPPEELTTPYTPYQDDPAMQRLMLELQPAALTFHFGLPGDDHIEDLKKAGIRLGATATNAEEVRLIEKKRLDFVIAQGWGAGGHRGVFDASAVDEKMPTDAVLSVCLEETDLPVIAAGGIMTGSDIATFLGMGASACQLGTAFVACPESSTAPVHRRWLADPDRETVMTRAISGRPARGFVNRLTAIGDKIGEPAIPAYPRAYSIGKALHASAATHDSDAYGAFWAGTGHVRSRPLPAGELVATLVREYEAALERGV